jgi:adenosine deaminase
MRLRKAAMRYIYEYYIKPLEALSKKELSYLRGVDITGNEINSTEDTLKSIAYINHFIEKILQLREKEGIDSEFTVYAHVGEVFRTPEEGLEAIKIYAEQLKGIKYIVHAAALRYADMDRFKEICGILKAKKIGILISLASNLSTGAIEEISQYPAVSLIEAGVEVYPTTDDPGALGIDLKNEVMLLNRLIAVGL